MKPGLACILVALAGCQFAGLELPDLTGSAKEQAAAEETPVGEEAVSEEADRTAPAPADADAAAPAEVHRAEAAPAPGQVGEPAETPVTPREAAPDPEGVVEVPRPEPGGPARPEAAGPGEPPAPKETEAALAAQPVVRRVVRSKEEPVAAAGEPVGTKPPIGEEAPVAEPPKGSNFWFYFLVVLAMAVVGAAAWFFLQPPWKRSRWWRLFKAYVRDWQMGGAEETPPRGSPSLGVFSAAGPQGAGGVKSGRRNDSLDILKRPIKQGSGPETSLHLEDLSGDEATGPAKEAIKEEKKSPRYGDPLKPRETTGAGEEHVAKEAAGDDGRAGTGSAKAGAGTEVGSGQGQASKRGKKSRKGGRKRTTNVTLPVISKHTRKQK